jgi:ATP-dependent protease ClpP protease subunit
VADFKRAVSASVDLSIKALERWNHGMRAAADTADNVINIYDAIGYDYWTGGVTANSISAALSQMGSTTDVIVNINSPGGDVFEGLAIYNILRQHKGTVTVRVLGLAASAASYIALAGDRVEIARAGFFMIHNAWTYAAGNRNDFADIGNVLGEIDAVIAEIYAVRTGLDQTDLAAQMDAETWISGTKAVEQGFADGYLASDQVDSTQTSNQQNLAIQKMDLLMARAGMPIAERRSMRAALCGQPDVAPTNEVEISALKDVLALTQSLTT